MDKYWTWIQGWRWHTIVCLVWIIWCIEAGVRIWVVIETGIWVVIIDAGIWVRLVMAIVDLICIILK
jgi:hypothetical protein